MVLPVLRNSCCDDGVPACGACCRLMEGRIPGRDMPRIPNTPCPLLRGNACSVFGSDDFPDECRLFTPGSSACHRAQEAA